MGLGFKMFFKKKHFSQSKCTLTVTRKLATSLSKDHLLPPPILRQPSDGLWASSVSSVDIEVRT